MLTFGSGSVVSAAASSISDPEEGAARAVGNRGKKKKSEIRRELEKQGPQF